MLAVSEINGDGRPTATAQLQMQLVASTAQTQRIQAMDAGNKSAEANVKDGSAQSDTARLIRQSIAKRAAVDGAEGKAAKPETDKAVEAEARSVVEAQEASETDLKITAAFQARHALSDLLSVIRDPEDRMLPTSPSNDPF